jgi:3D-(3,5/4)-trihydroxycyclohexane-1,2-dione acylhydrolase (decyclizing)
MENCPSAVQENNFFWQKNKMKETRLVTMSQALIEFLTQQFVEFEDEQGKTHQQPFFAGCFGIFGHGNIAGIGEALFAKEDFPYYQPRNEQSMVHTAMAYAKVKKRTQVFACTTSIGPGATNMVTGAATATINRLPVLLLPGDIFSTRSPDPVLQQVEYSYTKDLSANDAFRPVSKFFDRIHRPEQLISSLLEAMRVLISPSDTGAVTLALPQDIQTEAYEYPEKFFKKRVWRIARNRADELLLQKAADWIRTAKKPIIVAGGGVKYSFASKALNDFAEKHKIPVGESYAGKGVVRFDKPYSLGGLGATGSEAAIEIARDADLVIGVGTRYSDFISASHSLFQNPQVRFVNINVCELDSFKHAALALSADAKVTLQDLSEKLGEHKTGVDYQKNYQEWSKKWDNEVSRIYKESNATKSPIDQTVVIDTLNQFMQKDDIMICAAGSLPGDLHKLWRATSEQNFHLEYGNSCMGYEIAGGLGVKMAAPQQEAYVLVGDGSYLMLNHEITTAIQEGIKINVLLLVNHGFASIGSLSESIGEKRFGTQYRFRNGKRHLGENLPIDYAANAKSLGAKVLVSSNKENLKEALGQAKNNKETTVIVIETNILRTVAGYHAWWEVPIAQTSTKPEVQKARKLYEKNKKLQKYYL